MHTLLYASPYHKQDFMAHFYFTISGKNMKVREENKSWAGMLPTLVTLSILEEKVKVGIIPRINATLYSICTLSVAFHVH